MKAPPPLPARRIFAAGVAITLILLIETFWISRTDPELAAGLIAGVTAEIFTGREGGVPVALTSGVPPRMVWRFSVMQDLAAAALTFPMAMWLLDRYHDSPRLPMRISRRIEHAAMRHNKAIRRFGPVGVFVFMLVPFLINGPLIAAVAGHIARIPLPRLIIAIIAASMAAAAVWVWFFDATLGIVERFGGRVGTFVVTGTILVAIVALAAWDLRRRQEPQR